MADSDIQQQVMAVLSDPMNLPSTFWDYMIKRWLRDAPVFPISQVFGFSQFTALNARVDAVETTTSTSYTNLGTTGPTLTSLPDGKYVLFFGALMFSGSSSDVAAMGLSLNAAAVDGNAVVRTQFATDYLSLSMATTASLSNSNNNTITAKYKSGSGATATFANRWLIALRYGNI